MTDDGSTEFAPEAGRYHLYVGRACPWAHRTLIGRRLMGLEDAISVSFLDPIRDRRGWAFTGGQYVDQVNGFAFLRDAYEATDPDYEARVSVPVMWDRERSVIVNNESADILRMFSTVFAPLAKHPIVLYPKPIRDEIDELNEIVYACVNDAVYKAGFAKRQAIYEREVLNLFQTLDRLDLRLADRRFLVRFLAGGDRWRLFTTWCASTPSTRSTSSARSASSRSTRTCGRTRGISTCGPAWPTPSPSTRSVTTTTAHTR